MMKRFACMLLAVVLIFGAMLSLASCQETEQDIYTIANTSNATAVNTIISYTAKNGDSLPGWCVMKSEGNNAIIEYDFYRYQYPSESAVDGEVAERIVHSSGKTYYYEGKYYDEDEYVAWVGAPSSATFKFALDASKLTTPAVSLDGKTLTARMTADACLEMFGFNLKANEDGVLLVLNTNGTYLTDIALSCESVSGAKISLVSSYTYNKLALDFSPITGEDDGE